MLLERIITTILIIIFIFVFSKVNILINDLTSKRDMEMNYYNKKYQLWIGEILDNGIRKGFILSEQIFNIEKNSFFTMKKTKKKYKKKNNISFFHEYNKFNINKICDKYDILNSDDNNIILNIKKNDNQRIKYIFKNDEIETNIIYKEFVYNEKTHNNYKILFNNKPYNKDLIYSELLDIINIEI